MVWLSTGTILPFTFTLELLENMAKTVTDVGRKQSVQQTQC
jgi:hypothetical protein